MATWRVVARGMLSSEEKERLVRQDKPWVGGHGYGTVPPGGPLPKISSHSSLVHAESADGALAKAKDALGDLVLFLIDDEAQVYWPRAGRLDASALPAAHNQPHMSIKAGKDQRIGVFLG